ncbi:hypothetical protein ACS0TY_013611 [Phlomoides rotata]
MIYLSWNAQWIGNDLTKNALHNLCKSHKQDWVALFEPKVMLSYIPSNYWRSLHLHFVVENERPNIWLLCKDEHVVNFSIIFMSNQVIVVHTQVNRHSWHLGFVHACTTYIPRRALWNDVKSLHLDNLCLMGDFNVVLGSHVPDVESSGSQFTWSTMRSSLGFMAAKLDQILASQGFLDLWHSLEVTVLARYSSDHHPLLLKRVKLCLRTWNKETFRDIFDAITATSAELLHIQNNVASLGDSSTLFEAKVECQVHLNDLLSQRHAHFMQKNRPQWLTDGDHNTKLFHTLHRARKSSNILSSMYISDTLSNASDAIGVHVVNYYTKLFTARAGGPHDYSILDSFMTPVISDMINFTLMAIPTEEEIKHAIFGMEGSSAPGPDGFGGCFYHACRDIIALDIYAAVRFFFSHNMIPSGLNSNFVTLIPKKPEANRVEDFRPIVMGNFMFKILTKILASRLGGFVGDCISPYQFGFIPVYGCTVALGSALVLSPLTIYLGILLFSGVPKAQHLSRLADYVICKFSS